MEKTTEGVWYCNAHEDGVVKAGDQKKCPDCGGDMKEIGWFEYANGVEEK